MELIRQIQDMRNVISNLRADKPSIRIGFVPTMGFLHQGHASLLQAARQQCDIVVLSIFVNPLQFGPNEDFERYPRDEARDLALAEAAGTDFVFSPSTAEMYPRPSKTKILISGVTEQLCGASRPGHFDGVGIVVTKLFQIIQPNAAFFGMKDAQQVAVIKQLVTDLNMPVEIVPCAIIREQDGLAMSSRNVYLQSEEREQALVLSRTLKQMERQTIEAGGDLPTAELKQAIRKQIEEMPLADIDYIEILAYPDLEPIERLKDAKQVIIALAVRFGKTRLIDNVIIQLQE
ncbi:pantoate--beta-alanine ligase [Paenibacillus sp. 1_12]|uniref:pantoate--beta-alanine ligase n=1 Tax=Paenibacillus sp. 1_12 TaxID=1566278 RepID=UPI0008E9CAD3|nr:pantoate--beta-alanine ligase [Paenibacillus sp. 1_12]SFK91100.1 pantoate--beta-alanine ligase [Paenibacillus sp. 1_12]